VQAIDLSAYPADRLAVAPGQPERRFSVIEEWIAASIQQCLDISAQRRDPIRIAPMQPIGEIDKASAIAGTAQRDDLDRGGFMRLPGCPDRHFGDR
jgi:hypothetical protein